MNKDKEKNKLLSNFCIGLYDSVHYV